MDEKELQKLLQQARYNRQERRKKEFYKAKRERLASGTPMAERADLKSVQCGFESRAEDNNA